jgi:diacylglycerol kinase
LAGIAKDVAAAAVLVAAMAAVVVGLLIFVPKWL